LTRVNAPHRADGDHDGSVDFGRRLATPLRATRRRPWVSGHPRIEGGLRMKRFALVAATMLASLAACSPGGGSHPNPSAASSAAPAAAVAAPQHYDAVLVTGSKAVSDELVKLNTASGDAWAHCCGTSNNNFTHIKDDKPIPPGDYRLISWSHVEPSGAVSYNVYRFDSRTGHSWVLVESTSGGAASWLDIATTITWQ
jgi:hypothetical protein